MGLFKVPPPGTKYIKLCAGSCLWYLCNSTKWPQPSILNTSSLRHMYPLLAMCPSLDFSSFMGLFTCISFAKTSPSHFFFLSSQGFTFFFWTIAFGSLFFNGLWEVWGPRDFFSAQYWKYEFSCQIYCAVKYFLLSVDFEVSFKHKYEYLYPSVSMMFYMSSAYLIYMAIYGVSVH